MSQNAIQIALVALFMTIFAGPSNLYARSGGDVSGGGSGCGKPGFQNPFFLLDFARYPSKVLENTRAGEPIERTKVLERLGFQNFRLEKTKAHAYLNERLKLWTNPETKALVDEIIRQKERIRALNTTYAFKVKTPIFNDQQGFCPATNVETVALYFNKIIAISVPAWERLDLVSQAGLLLHEALRVIQISENENYSDKTEQELRDFVAHVMLFSPGEDPQFNFADRAESFLFSRFEKLRRAALPVQENFCKWAPRWKDRAQTLGMRLLKRAGGDSEKLGPHFVSQVIQSVCASKVSSDWGVKNYDVLRVFFNSYLGPVIKGYIRSFNDDKGAVSNKQIKDYVEEMNGPYVDAGALLVVASYYSENQMVSRLNGITEVFQSLTSGTGVVAREVSEYLNGSRTQTPQERIELEKAIDKARESFQSLLENELLL